MAVYFSKNKTVTASCVGPARQDDANKTKILEIHLPSLININILMLKLNTQFHNGSVKSKFIHANIKK